MNFDRVAATIAQIQPEGTTPPTTTTLAAPSENGKSINKLPLETIAWHRKSSGHSLWISALSTAEL